MNIKKIIAREGLIIIGWGLLFISSLLSKSENLLLCAIFAYPVYIIIRFIAWAIRILMSKD
ncbi:MAG: hypothetical protein ISS45_07830 [Candidatus Omnitrophica bacterium]|nr:hypothetical protein [Candidatus Omnitrophota bacterium]